MCTLCRIVIIVSYYPIKQLLDFCCCKNLHKVGWTKEIAILNGISNFHRGLLRSVLNRRREEEYRRGVFASRFVFCYNFRTKHLPGSRRFALIFICKTHRQGLYSELRELRASRLYICICTPASFDQVFLNPRNTRQV